MSKKNYEKVKEAISFFICAAVLLGIGFYSGFFNNFNSKDIENSFKQLGSDLSGGKNASQNGFSINKGSRGRIAKYRGYQPNEIPKAVLDGANSSNTWTNVLYSDKKAIFYVYSNSGNDNLNSRVQFFIQQDKNANFYNVYAYSEGEFNSVRAVEWGTSKICDSLEECNQVRLKASNYSLLSEFFKRCSRTMCIINPKRKQYFILRERDPQNAIKILEDLKMW